MGKRDTVKQNLLNQLDKFIFTKINLYDRACEFDRFVDQQGIPFNGLEIVGSNFITYLSNDGCNIRVKITESKSFVEIL